MEQQVARLVHAAAASARPGEYWAKQDAGVVKDDAAVLVCDPTLVRLLLRDPKTCSSATQASDETSVQSRLEWFDSMSLLRSDGERHRKLRSPIVKFLNNHFDQIEIYIRSLIAEQASDFLSLLSSGSEADFVASYCQPVSQSVAGALVGLDCSAAAVAAELSDRINSIETSGGDIRDAERMLDDLILHIARAQKHARDDLAFTSTLHRLANEARWSKAELECNLVMLFTAGYLTSRDALSSLPQVLTSVDRVESGQVADTVLREFSPIQLVERRASETFAINGTEVAKDDSVYLVTGANSGLLSHGHAFGIGPHFCAGARIARTEIECTAEVLDRARDSWIVSNELRREPGSFGYRRVLVRARR